jgi:hypothetical protein
MKRIGQKIVEDGSTAEPSLAWIQDQVRCEALNLLRETEQRFVETGQRWVGEDQLRAKQEATARKACVTGAPQLRGIRGCLVGN